MAFFKLHLLLGACWALPAVSLTVPSKALWFQQKVNHFSASNATYLQRYYMDDKHWAGPGSPIFVIMGGERGIPPEMGIFWPWISEVLARQFGGLVLVPEHRFYGESLPYGPASYEAEHLKGATWSLEDGDGSKFGPLKKHWFLIVILVCFWLVISSFIFWV